MYKINIKKIIKIFSILFVLNLFINTSYASNKSTCEIDASIIKEFMIDKNMREILTKYDVKIVDEYTEKVNANDFFSDVETVYILKIPKSTIKKFVSEIDITKDKKLSYFCKIGNSNETNQRLIITITKSNEHMRNIHQLLMALVVISLNFSLLKAVLKRNN